MKKNAPHQFTRRNLLEVCSMASGALLVRQTMLPGVAHAAGTDPNFLLLVYFNGGWDQLLALDPRPQNDPKYQRANAVKPGGTGIAPDYDLLTPNDAALEAAVAATANRSGVIKPAGSNITFGPAMPPSLTSNFADLAVVRGVSMDTLTHEVGRRYLLTGKFPRGLAPSGSSLNTVFTERTGSTLDLPNLALDIESYNEGLPAAASPILVTSAADISKVLTPGAPELTAAMDAKLMAFEGADDTCNAHGFNANGLVTAFRNARAPARQLANVSKASMFKFIANPPAGSQMEQLYLELGINSANPTADLNGPKGQVAVAAQALTQGVSQVASLTIVGALDDHFDEAGSQSVKLRSGFDALGSLINYLKKVQVPGTSKNYWQCTTMLVFSEFARTPLLNSRDGRDHHLASSCLIAGPGIKGNTVFGATSDSAMGVQAWNFTTGAPDPSGKLIRPVDIHATLLDSLGYSYSHLSNQTPYVITRLKA